MCEQVESIYRAIEYIESHLQSNVSIAQIAESSGYSLFHFVRTFSRVVHHTPYDYLIRRRLSEAAQALTKSRYRIIDISQDFCFGSQESFSRAFKRMFGMQPSQWREKRLENPTMVMPSKTWADLQFINSGRFQYPVIEELNEMTVYGLMTALDVGHQARQRQRNRLFSDLNHICSGNVPYPCVAVTSYIDLNCTKAYYFVGTNNSDLVPAFPTLVTQILPPGRYVKIDWIGDERRSALNYLYFTCFPRAGLRPSRQVEIEICSFEKKHLSQTTLYIPIEID